MGVFCHILHKDYRNTLIQVCCLEGVTQSPILAHFDGTLSWSAPIHAYDQQVDFQEEFKRRVDKNSRTFLTIAECNVWFYQCLDWMSAGIQAVIMVVLMINWFLGIGINSGLIALVLSNMAGIDGALGEISYSMADLEQGMQSVECLLQYSLKQSLFRKSGLFMAQSSSGTIPQDIVQSFLLCSRTSCSRSIMERKDWHCWSHREWKVHHTALFVPDHQSSGRLCHHRRDKHS